MDCSGDAPYLKIKKVTTCKELLIKRRKPTSDWTLGIKVTNYFGHKNVVTFHCYNTETEESTNIGDLVIGVDVCSLNGV